jgi:hypothetical protein
MFSSYFSREEKKNFQLWITVKYVDTVSQDLFYSSLTFIQPKILEAASADFLELHLDAWLTKLVLFVLQRQQSTSGDNDNVTAKSVTTPVGIQSWLHIEIFEPGTLRFGRFYTRKPTET